MVSLSGKPSKNLSVYDEIFRDFTVERRTCMIPTLERGEFQLIPLATPPSRSCAACRQTAAASGALRQQQPVVAGVFDQSASGFHQPLLQAGERPVGDRCPQRQPASTASRDQREAIHLCY